MLLIALLGESKTMFIAFFYWDLEIWHKRTQPFSFWLGKQTTAATIRFSAWFFVNQLKMGHQLNSSSMHRLPEKTGEPRQYLDPSKKS